MCHGSDQQGIPPEGIIPLRRTNGCTCGVRRSMSTKARLDLLLVERGLAPTRAKAQGLIMAGQVYVADQKRTKAGEQVAVDAPIEVRGGLGYVGRGGLKLAHALD